MNLIELLGTGASIVVALSLTMKNIRWLRWVNLVGAGLFALYGLEIQAWPVFGLNAFIVAINLYFLIQMSSSQDQFSLLEVPVADASPGTGSLLSRFLAHYSPDLARHQPDFPRKLPEGSRVFFVLREVLPIGLFVCRESQPGIQEVLVDYAVPAWRDYQNARFVFQKGLKSIEWGAPTTLIAKASVRSHQKYLRRMGFRPTDGSSNQWTLSLESAKRR